jgi:hypothetical protein
MVNYDAGLGNFQVQIGTATPLSARGLFPRWKSGLATVCEVSGPTANRVLFRAPLTGNPREGNLKWTGASNIYLIAEKFKDHVGEEWYRVAEVVDKDSRVTKLPLVQIEPPPARGEIWVRADELGAAILGSNCAQLPFAIRYSTAPISWTTFQLRRTFQRWPIDVGDIYCGSSVSVPREIHALGFAPPSGVVYPAPCHVHNGVDIFVRDETNVNVVSMDDGIVVGIGIEGDPNNAQGAWGANEIVGAANGFAVIVRYGHLYVLYGHLASIDTSIWVGAPIKAGDPIGLQGKLNERHLHIEVHSYGSSVRVPQAISIKSNGLLPFGPSAIDYVPPYVYDLMQFLPDPDTGFSGRNGGRSLRDVVATANLSLVAGSPYRSAVLNLSTVCTGGSAITYQTSLGGVTSNSCVSCNEHVIDGGYGYRGFVVYGSQPDTCLPSPFLITATPSS